MKNLIKNILEEEEDLWGWAEQSQEEVIDNLFDNPEGLMDYSFSLLDLENGVIDAIVDYSTYYIGKVSFSELPVSQQEININWDEGEKFYEHSISIKQLKTIFKAENSRQYYFFTDKRSQPIWDFVHPDHEETLRGIFKSH